MASLSNLSPLAKCSSFNWSMLMTRASITLIGLFPRKSHASILAEFDFTLDLDGNVERKLDPARLSVLKFEPKSGFRRQESSLTTHNDRSRLTTRRSAMQRSFALRRRTHTVGHHRPFVTDSQFSRKRTSEAVILACLYDALLLA
jgi:hypothetical protein